MLLTIKQKSEEDKGRSFSADLIAYVEADNLWSSTQTDKHRPVFAIFGASEMEMKAFMANLFTGRQAEKSDGGSWKLELLKTAGYLHFTQRCTNGGVLVTVFMPKLFLLDPGMVDPDWITFLCFPTKEWCRQQTFDLNAARKKLKMLFGTTIQSTDTELHLLLCKGALLLAYLDRRVRYPLIFDPVFGLYLMNNIYPYVNNFDSYQNSYSSMGMKEVGFESGFSLRIGQESFGTMLSTAVQQWYKAEEDSFLADLGDI